MLFPDTLYEKDLPSDIHNRQLILSIRDRHATAAVFNNAVPGSLRIVTTDTITVDPSGNWNGLEDFLYDNPGLLAPMASARILIDLPDVALLPTHIQPDQASAILRRNSVTNDAADPAHYHEIWHPCAQCIAGLLIPSKLHRFITRSFQPVEIEWYATPIVQQHRQLLLQSTYTTAAPIDALAVISPADRLTITALDTAGNLIAAISRKATTASDFAYHILSLLTSLTTRISSQVNLSIHGSTPAIIASLKTELSGWIDAQLHIPSTGKSSVIEPAQLHLVEPDILAAISTSA